MTQQTKDMKLKYILFCDDVIIDEVTKKPTFKGVFDEFASSNFPAVHERMKIVLALEEFIAPSLAIDLRLIDSQTGQEMGTLQLNPTVGATPNNQLRIDVTANNLPLPAAGKYELRVSVNGDYLGSGTLLAKAL